MTAAPDTRADPCIFCTAPDSRQPSPLLLFRGRHCYVVLNKFPYSNGHLLIVPCRHVRALAEANADELNELMALTQRAERVLAEAYAPHGFNVGMNLGQPAGAGVPGHVHIHVVPRWDGDTNFMTVTAGTRVIPEDPDETVRRLRPLFGREA